MAFTKLSKEQDAILNLVRNFGCVDINQIIHIYDIIPEATIRFLVKFLAKQRYFDFVEDRYLIDERYDKKVDVKALSCIWAMIKVASARDEIIGAYKAAEPAFSYMTVAQKHAYEFLFITAPETVKLREVQNRMKQYEHDGFVRSKFIFVTTDAGVKDMIKKSTFNDTVYLAFLTYDSETKIPDVHIMSKKVKKEAE